MTHEHEHDFVELNLKHNDTQYADVLTTLYKNKTERQRWNSSILAFLPILSDLQLPVLNIAF